jgi:hypothetical protein
VSKAICGTVDAACDRLERDGRSSVHKPIASPDAVTQTVSGSPHDPTECIATIDRFRLREICVKENLHATRSSNNYSSGEEINCCRTQNCLTFFPESRRGSYLHPVNYSRLLGRSLPLNILCVF